MSERCETCRYWDQWATNNTVGGCRRYPKPADIFPGMQRSWPNTLHEDWCGEWRAKENEGDPLPPNPNLDAAAAMGGMGEPDMFTCADCGQRKHKIDWCAVRVGDVTRPDGSTGKAGSICRSCAMTIRTEVSANTCPVCHTPGGEHAPECKMCKCMWGVVEAAPWCPDCSGAGRVLVEDKEKDDG